MMPSDRKSVEPMAAMTAPERTAAQHQALLGFLLRPEIIVWHRVLQLLRNPLVA